MRRGRAILERKSAERQKARPAPFLHQPREVRLARLQHEMVVIAHQAVSQRDRVEALQSLRDDTQQRVAVRIVLEDRLSPVAPRGDVIDRVREFNA